MTVKKSDIYASIGTVIACVLILLILFFCGMSVSRDEMDEGIQVSFGEELEGFGSSENPMEPEAEATEADAASAPSEQTPNVAENLMTQEDESVALAQEKKRQEEQARLLAEQQERDRKAKEEAARIAAENAAKKAAENAAKTEKANNLASIFGQNAGSGSGTTTGDATAGNPAGSGTSGGNGWSLKGRSLKGALPKPTYSGNEQGRIIVRISVDRSGKVIDAVVDPSSNITTKALRDACVEAAKKATFSSGTDNTQGTITYNFKLN